MTDKFPARGSYEFMQTLRRKCRQCGTKLPAPVSNEREAFCVRNCYESFYLHRCRVCERSIGQLLPKRGRPRFLCDGADCRNHWRTNSGFGRYRPAPPANGVYGVVEDDDYKRLNAGNRLALKAYFAKPGPTPPPTSADRSPSMAPLEAAGLESLLAQIPDDLSIPDFLLRKTAKSKSQ